MERIAAAAAGAIEQDVAEPVRRARLDGCHEVDELCADASPAVHPHERLARSRTVLDDAQRARTGREGHADRLDSGGELAGGADGGLRCVKGIDLDHFTECKLLYTVSTRERILTATRRLLEGGRVNVGLEDVAKRAGVSRQAVYLIFGSRAQLLLALVDAMDRRAAARADPRR